MLDPFFKQSCLGSNSRILPEGGDRGILKVVDFDTLEPYDDTTRAYDVMGTDQ